MDAFRSKRKTDVEMTGRSSVEFAMAKKEPRCNNSRVRCCPPRTRPNGRVRGRTLPHILSSTPTTATKPHSIGFAATEGLPFPVNPRSKHKDDNHHDNGFDHAFSPTVQCFLLRDGNQVPTSALPTAARLRKRAVRTIHRRWIRIHDTATHRLPNLPNDGPSSLDPRRVDTDRVRFDNWCFRLRDH